MRENGDRKNVRNEIWDYKNGVVINADTGEIIEKIYDDSFFGNVSKDEKGEVLMKIRAWRNEKYRYKLQSIYRNLNKELSRYENFIKRRMYKKALSKGHFIIDNKKLEEGLRSNRFVYVLLRKTSLSVLSNMPKDEIELYESLIEILSQFTTLLFGKSLRSKYATIYMLINYLETGSFPRIEEVARKFEISMATVMRIRKSIKNLGDNFIDKLYEICKN